MVIDVRGLGCSICGRVCGGLLKDDRGVYLDMRWEADYLDADQDRIEQWVDSDLSARFHTTRTKAL